MARMPAPTPDLEIEDPDGSPLGSNRTFTGVQVAAILIVAGAVLAIVFPLRAHVNRSEAGRLQRRWAAMVALDQARSADLTTLTRAGAPGDAVQVHSTAGNLYDQQAVEVASLRRSLHSDVIVDSGLRRLRAAMTRALTLEAADLSNAATLWRAAPVGRTPSYLDRQPATTAAIATAGQLLAVEATRFSLPAQRQTTVPHFQAADATIASFKRFLDQPAGVSLLADTSAGLQTIDIDHSVIRPAPLAGLPAGVDNIVVARPDFLVFQHPAGAGSRSSFYVAPADLHSPAVAIGSGGQVVAGSTAGTFWLIGLDDTAVEVDRGGAVLAGPVALPPNRFVVGATAAGLVLQPHLQSDQSQVPEPIELWDPLQVSRGSQASVRTITDLGLGVVAADAGTIAWVSASDQLQLSDVASGADRTVDTRGYAQDLVGAAFSPNGSRLATTMRSQDGSHTVPAVVVVGSGIAQIGASEEFPPEQPGPIAWTASGDRIFVPMSSATPADQVMTYRPGDGGPHYLRLPDTGRIEVFAVVAVNSG